MLPLHQTKNKMDEVNEAQEKLIQQVSTPLPRKACWLHNTAKRLRNAQTLAKQRLTTDPVQELDMDAVHSMVAQQAALWKARDKARGVVPEPRE